MINKGGMFEVKFFQCNKAEQLKLKVIKSNKKCCLRVIFNWVSLLPYIKPTKPNAIINNPAVDFFISIVSNNPRYAIVKIIPIKL